MKKIFSLLTILAAQLTFQNIALAGEACTEVAAKTADIYLESIYKPYAENYDWEFTYNKQPTIDENKYTFEIYENEHGGNSGTITVVVSKYCSPIHIYVEAPERYRPRQ